MDQAINAHIDPATVNQVNLAEALTIRALAARYMQLIDSGNDVTAQNALLDLILRSEPRDRDEARTLLGVVHEDVEDEPLAQALEAIMRTMDRDGEHDLLAPA